MADARRLAELGMVPPLAKEVAAQITAGIGDKRRLAELSMVPRLALELQTQINTKTVNALRLCELSMVPALAKEVITQIAGSSTWYDSDVWDTDFANGKFRFNNTEYASEALLNTAAGITKTGNVRVNTAPYIDPALTNLLVNGDFSSGTTGWAASGTGASIANVGGELEFTSGGSLNAFSQGVSGTQGKAFVYRLTGRRGTTANSISISSGINNTVSGSIGSIFGTTSNQTFDLEVSSVADTTYFGARNSSGAGSGTFLADNGFVWEARPFLGFQNTSIAGAIQATAAAAATVDEVLWQCDDNSERNRIRVARLVADDTLHVIVTGNNATQADLNMGVVADGAAFEISFSCTQNAFYASLNGAYPVQDVSGYCPSATRMRIGRSFTGDLWTGSIERVTVF